MAELHVHGSKAVVKELQETLLSTKKCRLAEPGEFTKLAFLNGKINLLTSRGNRRFNSSRNRNSNGTSSKYYKR